MSGSRYPCPGVDAPPVAVLSIAAFVAVQPTQRRCALMNSGRSLSASTSLCHHCQPVFARASASAKRERASSSQRHTSRKKLTHDIHPAHKP